MKFNIKYFNPKPYETFNLITDVIKKTLEFYISRLIGVQFGTYLIVLGTLLNLRSKITIISYLDIVLQFDTSISVKLFNPNTRGLTHA